MSATASATAAPAALPDSQALRSCWHPVAFAGTLGAAPLRVTLLGEPLALWRDSAGEPHVAVAYRRAMREQGLADSAPR